MGYNYRQHVQQPQLHEESDYFFVLSLVLSLYRNRFVKHFFCTLVTRGQSSYAQCGSEHI